MGTNEIPDFLPDGLAEEMLSRTRAEFIPPGATAADIALGDQLREFVIQANKALRDEGGAV